MTLKDNKTIFIQISVIHLQNEEGLFKTVPFVNVYNHLFDDPKIIMLDELTVQDLDLTVAFIKKELYNWLDTEYENPSLYVLWHNIYFIRSEFRQEWEQSIEESKNKNVTTIYKNNFSQVEGRFSFTQPNFKNSYSLLSIEKCLIKMNLIDSWEKIIEETFNGASNNLDLSLDNIKDTGNFIFLYKKILQSYASVLIKD